MAKEKKYGFYLDGETSIEIGTAVDLKLTDASFTIEAWIFIERYKSGNTNGDATILGSKDHGSTKSSTLHLTIRNGVPYMGFYNNDIQSGASGYISEGYWYHLAFVYNKLYERQTIFFNGLLYGYSSPKDGDAINPREPFQGRGPIVIGNWGKLNSYMQGMIRDLRIWDSALPPSKILDSMNSGLKKTAPGLTAYWTFKDGLVNRHLNEQNKKGKLKQIEGLKSQIDNYKLSEKDLQTQIAQLQKEAEENAKIKAQLEEKTTEIARLNEKIEQNAQKNSSVTIAKLIEDANKQITSAREQLKNSDYHLGHVNMQFKMIPAKNGDAVVFPSPNEINNGADTLSTIDLEFSPKEATKQPEVQTKQLPDVRGLTEIMARRKIAQAGFLTEVKFQATQEHRNKDRVIKQIPDPSKTALAEVNSTILIFIGKEIIQNG